MTVNYAVFCKDTEFAKAGLEVIKIGITNRKTRIVAKTAI
jgi:hypothetical protein